MKKIILFITSVALISCNNPMANKKNKSPENEQSEIVSEQIDSKRYTVIPLPKELTEVSGITFLNDSVVLAIADEEGVLYYYDLIQNKVVKKQSFGKPDDYEDLVIVGDDLYIVVSNGLIHHLKNFAADK